MVFWSENRSSCFEDLVATLWTFVPSIDSFCEIKSSPRQIDRYFHYTHIFCGYDHVFHENIISYTVSSPFQSTGPTQRFAEEIAFPSPKTWMISGIKQKSWRYSTLRKGSPSSLHPPPGLGGSSKLISSPTPICADAPGSLISSYWLAKVWTWWPWWRRVFARCC